MRIPPALYHRRFTLLWLGLMLSVAGTQMQTWSLLWHIRELTEQPIALGGIGLARILPVLVFSLIGGALADVVNRRKLMFVTQTVQAVLAALLGFMTLGGHITIWHIYLLTAIQAVATAFDLPARQALVPNLVPARDLPSAFSMTSIAFTVGSIVGPALSGIVIAGLNLESVYFINAISYGAVLVALILMGPVVQQTGPGRPKINFGSIQEGFRFIFSQPILLSTMLIDFTATFFSSANTLLPLITKDVLKAGPVVYGWLSAAQSVGAMISALIVSQLEGIRRQGMIFLTAVVVFGLATILLGISTSVVIAFLALFLIGASDSVSTIIRNTLRQLQTPDHIRGRMTSVNQIFFMGGPQLGEVEAGLVAQLFGVPFAVISGGIGCILGVLLIARRWPQLVAFNGDEPVLAGKAAD